MKFSIAAVAASAGVASAAVASTPAGFANLTTITVPKFITSTTVVNEYVTYCPEPTTITEGNKTIIVTKPGTITVTDCPCTRTTVSTTSTVTTCPVSDITKTPVPTVPLPTPLPPSSKAPNVTVPPITIAPPAQGGAAAIGVSGALAGVVAAAAYFL